VADPKHGARFLCIMFGTMSRKLLFTLSFLLFASVAWAQKSSGAIDLEHSQILDLTYSFDQNTIYWPTAEGFKWTKDAWGPSPGGYFYASASYGASEHGGTHIDSPLHFAEGHEGTDAIPVTRLIAPAIVIDVSAECERNPDYLVSADDIAHFEKAHGRIPQGSIALIRTGWGKYWPDAKRYLGTNEKGPGAVAKLHFPGISADASHIFVERKVSGVGIDTASVDYGQSKDFQTHRILYSKDIYGLENVAHLDQVPVTGALLIALPMKIKDGTGGPVRIVAVLPESTKK
jgi:kynurenine formamidase